MHFINKMIIFRYKDNKALTPGSRYWINRDGGHCTLTIRDVMDSDTGQYTCKISNPAGETSCTAALELPSNNPVLLSLTNYHC